MRKNRSSRGIRPSDFTDYCNQKKMTDRFVLWSVIDIDKQMTFTSVDNL